MTEGDPVGLAGANGDAEWPTPYVHLGIRVSAAADGYLDPATLLPPRTVLPPPSTPPSPAPAPEPSRRGHRPIVTPPPAATPTPGVGSPSTRRHRPRRLSLRLRPRPRPQAAPLAGERGHRPGAGGRSARTPVPAPASTTPPVGPCRSARWRRRRASLRGFRVNGNGSTVSGSAAAQQHTSARFRSPPPRRADRARSADRRRSR